MRLTVKDAARLLSVSEKTVYRWIKQETIPVYRLNDQYRFNRVELLEWATANRISVSPEIFEEAEGAQNSLPSLSDALNSGGVAYRVGGKDLSSVFRSVLDVMKLPEEVDREFLHQVLLTREKLGSTGIGDGIAIPHVRNPIVLHVNKPSVTLCFLENPIDFGAIDGQPVDILFVIVSPTVRAHLHLLSRLSFILQNSDFKDKVKSQASREELMDSIKKAESLLPSASNS